MLGELARMETPRQAPKGVIGLLLPPPCLRELLDHRATGRGLRVRERSTNSRDPALGASVQKPFQAPALCIGRLDKTPPRKR